MDNKKKEQSEIEAANERLKGFAKRASEIDFDDPKYKAACEKRREIIRTIRRGRFERWIDEQLSALKGLSGPRR